MKKLKLLLLAILTTLVVTQMKAAIKLKIKFNDLPIELLDRIAQCLEDKDASEFACVSKKINAVVEGLRSQGKLRYPTLKFWPKSEYISACFSNQLLYACPIEETATQLFSTRELGLHMDSSHNFLTRGIIINAQYASHLPSQIIRYKKLKKLYLNMPALTSTNDVAAQAKDMRWFHLKNLKRNLIRIGYEEGYSDHDQIIKNYANFLEKKDSLVDFDTLIDQLPELQHLVLMDTKGDEHHFKGKNIPNSKKYVADLTAKI